MDRRNSYKHTKPTSSFIKNKIEVIDLANDVPLKSKQTRIVDLTKSEPEVIVLDDTISQCDSSLNEREIVVSDVDDNWIDLINYNAQPTSNLFNLSRSKRKINFLNAKNKSSHTSDPGILFTERDNNKECLSKSANINKKRRCKMENIFCESNMVLNVNKPGLKSLRRKFSNQNNDSILLQLQKKGTTKKRNRNVNNINISDNIPVIITDQSSKPLSDHVQTYYRNVDKVVKKLNKKSKKSMIQSNSNVNTKKDYRTKDTSIINKVNKINKKPKGKKPQKLKVKCEYLDTINSGRRRSFKPCNNLFVPFRENNIYNPNPYEVESEGFRPIVIDGSNIAIGHGRGKFSVKGVKICVDYFATRGHKHVKVFLPQFRQELFPKEMLKELQTKCGMVFTPSSDINGVRKTPYDDRFIVQYAVEFSGIIVSTDNYRDLLKENPRWQETIKSRLLMFTWVDDFLMFPMDPLGRRGPSLEQFLRF